MPLSDAFLRFFENIGTLQKTRTLRQLTGRVSRLDIRQGKKTDTEQILVFCRLTHAKGFIRGILT